MKCMLCNSGNDLPPVLHIDSQGTTIETSCQPSICRSCQERIHTFDKKCPVCKELFAKPSQKMTCRSCAVTFDQQEQKAHYKSDLHRFNLKRKVANMPPVTQEVFDQKVQGIFHHID
jgi:hypothetical protein